MENWHLKGTFYESCRQKGHCGLWFGRDLTEGPCSNFAIFEIEEGQINGVDMAGITFIECGDGIGPTQKDFDISSGGGIKEGTVYVSDNASEEQRAIMKEFMQNHMGTEIWKKVLDIKFVPIKIEHNKETDVYHITYPYGETKLSKATGLDGKYVTAQNVGPYNLSVPILDYHICNSWEWWYKDMGKDYSFKHTSGTIGKFDIGSDTKFAFTL